MIIEVHVKLIIIGQNYIAVVVVVLGLFFLLMLINFGMDGVQLKFRS